MSSTLSSDDSTPQVHLLELASAAVACTVTASRLITALAAESSSDGTNQKNTRLKDDGSFVTDADFAAQGIIVQAVQSVFPSITILGEESPEEMASHIGKHTSLDHHVMDLARQEIWLRYHQQSPNISTTAMPLSKEWSASASTELPRLDPATESVDASRVAVIVDPLDGTKSYAYGDYESVSILIAIILDNEPWFGVIGKPFGYSGYPAILDTGCVTIYGGPLVHGVFIAGGERIQPTPLVQNSSNVDEMPRAVISGSRSKGLVHDFCIHLGSKGLIHPEPMLVNGAGEKSLRLILQQENEALWFYPKSGTSLWDVAAPDALLRSLGGRLTDKYGNPMDYNKQRSQAENMDGVIACIDASLHAECIRLFREGDWGSRS